MNEKKSTKIVKKRNWAIVSYPESMPPDWKEKLTKTGCPISYILHDKDLNEDGTQKKPHYHIIVCYSGPTSLTVVKRLSDSINAPSPQALEQVKGYYRYLTHMDNPEKYQYPKSDIVFLNGFSPLDFIEITKSQVITIKKDLLLCIEEYDITEYFELCKFVLNNYDDDVFDVVSSNTYFFQTALRSYNFEHHPII